jgi:putative Holliday junction resolvase
MSIAKMLKSSQIPSRVNRNIPSIVVFTPALAGYHQSVSEVQLSGQLQPWLGLDVGTRRIGVALSNALGVAQPLLTIERTQLRRDQRSILRLARRHGCAGIVVGNPLHLSGDRSPQTDRVHRFVDELKALIAETSEANVSDAGHLSFTVHLWDERLSTAEVHAALEATGRDTDDRRIRRQVVDKLAAALILQGWLDARSGSVTLLPPGP